MADERTRYSDAELEEFKQLILKKLESARADYELLRATITHTADNDTEDTSPTFKVLEEGAATLSKEESGRLAAHQMKFIRNLEMAPRWKSIGGLAFPEGLHPPKTEPQRPYGTPFFADFRVSNPLFPTNSAKKNVSLMQC